MIQTLPAILFYSYHPLIPLGETSFMHLELSLPLLWLATISLLALPRLPEFFKNSPKTLLFALSVVPCYTFLSLLWSANPLRTFLSAGVLACLSLTILSLIHTKIDFKKALHIWLYAAVLVSAFAWLQSLLDVLGVDRTYTLLCEGCTSAAFGFPHPNSFAIEPQFFGNLLLAPVFYSYYSLLENKSKKSQVKNWGIAIFLTTTLFFTFSRGAIFAYALGLLLLLCYHLYKHHKTALKLIPLALCSFLLSLTLQALSAQLSYTSATFGSAVATAVNHLSLGAIDIRGVAGSSSTGDFGGYGRDVAAEPCNDRPLGRGRPEAYRREDCDPVDDAASDPLHEGYVEESTTFRLSLTDMALATFQQAPLLGLGLGGTGVVLYQSFPELGTEQQIIQNEYASLLLEFGLVGCALTLLAIFLLCKFFLKNQKPSIYLVSLCLAYAFTLCFFSGLPNALHLYLLPLFIFLGGRRSLSGITSSVRRTLPKH